MLVLACPLHHAAQVGPQSAGCLEQNRIYLYAQLSAAADRIAGWLKQEAGLREGQRVALCMAPQWRWQPILFALWRLGAVACPLSPRQPPDVLKRQLAFLDPAFCIADPDSGLPGCSPLEVCAEGSSMELPALAPTLDGDRPATILFTSGSGGKPRAVVHTFAAHYYSALGANRHLPLHSQDRWLLSLPLHHVGGFAVPLRTVLAGASVAYPTPGEDLASSLEALKITRLSLVPTQLLRLLRHPALPRFAPRIQRVLLGGGPIDPGLLERAREAGLPVHSSYGLTEMASQVSTVPRHSPPSKARTAGTVLPYRQVRINADGGIEVRGETRMLGLWNGTGIDALPAEAWLPTGDVGGWDADGYLKVLGRADQMYVSGGENVFPEEVETALLQIPGVERAVVVSLPDPEFGARGIAFLSGGVTLDPPVLIERLRAFLPGYKIPRTFLPLEEPEGLKPDRARLREQALRAVQG